MTMADLGPEVRRLLRIGAAALALAFLAFVAHAAIGSGQGAIGGVFDTWVYDGLLLGAAGACFARARLVENERAAWIVMGLGLTVWSSGEIYYSLAFSGAQSVPIPSLADAGYLAFYPIAYVGLIMLLRARVGAFSGAQWLDGAIVGSAVASVAAALALGPIVAASTTGSAAAVATNLAYPIADLALLTLVVTAAAFTGWRPGLSWIILGGGLIVLALSDGTYLLQSAQGTYVEGGLLDAAWPLGALLIAAAAWLDPGPRRVPETRGLRIAVVPAAAALVAVALQFYDHFEPIPILAEVLSLVTLFCVVIRMALSFRENQASLQNSVRQALTDALTGLGNRRRLMTDLGSVAARAPAAGELHLFVLFDLDGFKAYNDAFGHPAGDALLARLGSRVAAFAEAHDATAYRLGGDEFCLLAESTAAGVDGLVAGAAAALSERGNGFVVTASRGVVLMPSEASSSESALQLADRRMYASKSRERASAGAQSRDVLVTALRERQPALHSHLTDVATFALGVAEELKMNAEQRDEVVRAAELHDTGKMAIPDALLNKPGPLDEQEWEFMRGHTVIGERIIGSAPALGPVALLVRSSHERWDGEGYPDGLSEEEIPLGSRVVAVCDSYEAMISARPYGKQMTPTEALAELARCAGTQFDPAVVAAFTAVAESRASEPGAGRRPSFTGS
jgi:two-component system cell cycle response regulator